MNDFPQNSIAYLRVMPLYYYNNKGKNKMFYTDAGGMREIIRIPYIDDIAKLTFYIGTDDTTRCKRWVDGNRSCEDMAIFTGWLTTSIFWDMYLDKRLHAEAFKLDIGYILTAELTASGDMVVYYNDDQLSKELFDAFQVPTNIQARLLSRPGSLIMGSRRTSQYRFMGFFKSIKDLLGLSKIESMSCEGFIPVHRN